MAIVLNSLTELRGFVKQYAVGFTHVDSPKKYEVIIPCRSDRAMARLGHKTVNSELTDREVVGIMQMMVPPHSKKSSTVRVF